MKRSFQLLALLGAALLLPLLGAGLYDLTAPAAPAAAPAAPAPAAPQPLVRPALWLVAPSSTSSAPPVYAA